MLYVLLAWFIVITVLNGFAGNYAVGLLLVFSVLAVVVGPGAQRIGPPLWFFGFGLGATGIGGVLRTPPTTSLPILLLSMGTVTVVGGIVIHAHLAI